MSVASRWTERLSHRLAMHVPAAPFRMRRGPPMVSFTFDDVPASAGGAGAALLEEAGARGTYYVASGLLGGTDPSWPPIDPDRLPALHRAGHEIGLHTHSHASFAGLDGDAVAGELRDNRAALAALAPGARLDNFAYPYGVASLAGKARLRGLVRSSRGIAPGVNHGRIDLHFLRAVPLYDRSIDRAGVERWLDEALSRDGWLIFLTHDVQPRPSPFGCSPGLLAAAIAAAGRRGIACVTVAAALDRIGFTMPADTALHP